MVHTHRLIKVTLVCKEYLCAVIPHARMHVLCRIMATAQNVTPQTHTHTVYYQQLAHDDAYSIVELLKGTYVT